MEPNNELLKFTVQNKKIILSITKFLTDEKTIRNFDSTERDSLDVAIQCLENLYHLDEVTKRELENDIVDIRELIGGDTVVSAEDEHEAEEYKNKGNSFMSSDDFKNAIVEYTKAIQLNPKNPVYYCNRAAAYNKAEQPLNAIIDCKNAIKLDPKYSKAYGRLGKAYSVIGLVKEAHEAYISALKHDPSNDMYRENLKYLDVSQDTGSQNNGLFNNSALFKIIIQLMENDSFRQVLENLTANENESPYINNLLQMGQVLVNRLQAPEIFQQLQGGRTVEELSKAENENPDGDIRQ
ncbi:hypothetical protein WA026_008543 [Henosepilachna vigintioctopunctata]|uniref:SGTA homodimerisation domain-containing protein n=1 Tax=Henosepilachna vigintioctopunctata TaxID=420089 RepID=A0AAW1UHN2_9CUCU